MNRKNDIDRRIKWAEENKQEIAKIPKPTTAITQSEIDKCMKLTSSAILHLNSTFDYCIRDFVEASKTKIRQRCYFPFVWNDEQAKLFHKLPIAYLTFLKQQSGLFSTDQMIPKTNIKYALLKTMRDLINADKHDKISVETIPEDRGNIQYEGTFGTVIVHNAAQIKANGVIINKHMQEKGGVQVLCFVEDKILSQDDRDIFHFLTATITGTHKIINSFYEFIDQNKQII